jgi:hypothetical protein
LAKVTILRRKVADLREVPLLRCRKLDFVILVSSISGTFQKQKLAGTDKELAAKTRRATRSEQKPIVKETGEHRR